MRIGYMWVVRLGLTSVRLMDKVRTWRQGATFGSYYESELWRDERRVRDRDDGVEKKKQRKTRYGVDLLIDARRRPPI